MNTEEVKQLLESCLEGCTVEIQGEGCNLEAVIVGDVFEGLRPLKRQQLVYGVLGDLIADGTIHAVNMKTLTRAEASQ